MRLAIGLLTVPTGGTGAARVPGINEDHRDTGRLRFVGDKGPQLPERPGRKRRSLWLSRPYPLANVRQVLQRYRALRAFSSGDDLFANLVVLMALKARLFAAALPQPPPGRLGALALQPGAGAAVPAAGAEDQGAGVLVPVRVGGNIDDAQVHAEHVIGIEWRLFGGVHRHRQKPLSVAEDQVGLPSAAVQPRCLVGAEANRDNDPPGKRQEGNAVGTLPRHEPLVVRERAVGPELGPLRLVSLERFTHFADRANRHLGRQAKRIAGRVVSLVLQLVFVRRAEPEGHARQVVAGGVERLQRLPQGVRLFWRRFQFDQQGLLHDRSIQSMRCSVNP